QHGQEQAALARASACAQRRRAARCALPGPGRHVQVSALPLVEIFTDGACKGNPGPGGWGTLMRFGTHARELHGGEPNTTNNRMELTAVIEGLPALTRRCHVKLFTDSQYVQKGITVWIHDWKRRDWRTADKKPVKNVDLWQRLDALA